MSDDLFPLNLRPFRSFHISLSFSRKHRTQRCLKKKNRRIGLISMRNQIHGFLYGFLGVESFSGGSLAWAKLKILFRTWFSFSKGSNRYNNNNGTNSRGNCANRERRRNIVELYTGSNGFYYS